MYQEGVVERRDLGRCSRRWEPSQCWRRRRQTPANAS
jgi:hypothetical protein